MAAAKIIIAFCMIAVAFAAEGKKPAKDLQTDSSYGIGYAAYPYAGYYGGYGAYPAAYGYGYGLHGYYGHGYGYPAIGYTKSFYGAYPYGGFGYYG